MEKRVYIFALILAVSTWTMGCAPAPGSSTVEEMCSSGNCTEAGLNAPTPDQEEPTPNFDDGNSMTVARGNYDHIDPTNVVPARPLELALAYFDKNYSSIKNKRWMSVVDMRKNSSQVRLYLIDMVTGKVTGYHVAHGKGSDSDGDGNATKFSNTNGTNASSIGFYFTAETYSGAHGYSLRLDGLNSTNSAARSRAIVIHPADYVSEKGSRAGRSWGCPAIDPLYSRAFIDKVKNGSLYYIYYNQ